MLACYYIAISHLSTQTSSNQGHTVSQTVSALGQQKSLNVRDGMKYSEVRICCTFYLSKYNKESVTGETTDYLALCFPATLCTFPSLTFLPSFMVYGQ